MIEYSPVSERWPDGVVPMGEYEDACDDRDRYRRALEEIILTAPNLGEAASIAHRALEGEQKRRTVDRFREAAS